MKKVKSKTKLQDATLPFAFIMKKAKGKNQRDCSDASGESKMKKVKTKTKKLQDATLPFAFCLLPSAF